MGEGTEVNMVKGGTEVRRSAGDIVFRTSDGGGGGGGEGEVHRL